MVERNLVVCMFPSLYVSLVIHNLQHLLIGPCLPKSCMICRAICNIQPNCIVISRVTGSPCKKSIPATLSGNTNSVYLHTSSVKLAIWGGSICQHCFICLVLCTGSQASMLFTWGGYM